MRFLSGFNENVILRELGRNLELIIYMRKFFKYLFFLENFLFNTLERKFFGEKIIEKMVGHVLNYVETK